VTYRQDDEYYRIHERHLRLGMHGGWTQGAIWTRRFLILLVVTWLIALIGPRLYQPMSAFFAAVYLTPASVITGLVWQPFTAPWFGALCMWLFPFHLLYLLVFGPKVEREWGNARFLRFYLSIAFTAGIISMLLRLPTPLAAIPASTTSAAIFAVMVAYASMWPRDPFYVFGLFPSPILYVVLVLCAFEILVMVLAPAAEFGVDYIAGGAGIMLGFGAMKIPFLHNLLIGKKKARIVTASGRARREEFTPSPAESASPSSTAEPSSIKEGKTEKKGKRSGFLEF
jgi:membrane associated rhomboid family serine protease